MDALTDKFGRKHSYLRISLTERCNLRCTYCMPEHGVPVSPWGKLMTPDEVFQIAKRFVEMGVKKIRLTGGEPLVRKDFGEILEKLSTLDVELSLTSNAVIVDRYIDQLKAAGVKTLNISLDSLHPTKFKTITRRDNFEKVKQNIDLLLQEGFKVKLNCVLIKNFNDNEIIDFIRYTQNNAITVRFIEFMPFDGNRWDKGKLVTHRQILDKVFKEWSATGVERLVDQAHDTSRNYRVHGFQGSFAIISTVTNPFCDSCNRIRLTANGRIKNCLFSNSEVDLLTTFREGGDIAPLVAQAVQSKAAMRGGMSTQESFSDPKNYNQNRSMIAIGG
ncbi:GTP 3',8-cyclase MoaA [Gilvibacter sp.]|uniref:GTP 3',8-cyclase MoaA n=1 Tax=Gilvibacter sp. TaxID=2729997 RepID=UPI0025B9FDCD|nr:GTP 3',8-cyclase MoaA [Gilvibacter sp.]NQX77979.1 GTP 3',8-cyclase MoaA [Gilvibacter sp.]